MNHSFDLSHLDPVTFEHLTNLLALRVLGFGHTGFGPGSDGGRDGYFEGEAPYPSPSNRWTGIWYIQAKFLSPSLSANPQKWLLDRIKEEIAEYNKPQSKRQWPDNWIIATNIDASGKPETGAFDLARSLVAKARPKLRRRFHIWGGKKFLTSWPFTQRYWQHTDTTLLLVMLSLSSTAKSLKTELKQKK